MLEISMQKNSYLYLYGPGVIHVCLSVLRKMFNLVDGHFLLWKVLSLNKTELSALLPTHKGASNPTPNKVAYYPPYPKKRTINRLKAHSDGARNSQ